MDTRQHLQRDTPFCRIILFCLIRAKMDQHPFDTENGVFSARCFQAASFERAEKAVPVTRVRLLFSHTGFSCSGAAMRLPERRNPAESCPLPRSGCCTFTIYIDKEIVFGKKTGADLSTESACSPMLYATRSPSVQNGYILNRRNLT